MKKGLIIVLALIFVAGLSTVIYFYSAKTDKASMEEVLPQGPLAYLKMSKIEKRVKEFTAGPFWQNLKAIDVAAVMEKSGIPPQTIADYKKMKDELADPATQNLFMKFFGEEAGFAIYPTEKSPSTQPLATEFLSRIIIVTRLKADAQFFELLNSLTSGAQNEHTRTEEYKGFKIQLVDLPNQNISIGYIRIKDLLILGLGDMAARKSIDVYLKSKPALNQDSTYLDSKTRSLNGAQTIGYANLDFIFSQLNQSLTQAANVMYSQNTEAIQELDKAFKNLKGFKAIAFSSITGPLLKQKFDLLYDPAQLNPSARAMYSCQPKENHTLHFIPANILSYQWSSCLDLKSQWQVFLEELTSVSSAHTEESEIRERIRSLEEALNLSIENDIIPAFGDEFGGYLADVNISGLFPIPKALFFVKVNDKLAAGELMDSLTDHQAMVLQTENYKSHQIKYLSLPLGEELQPGFTFIDNYLVIALSRQTIKESVDAHADPRLSLLESEQFKKINDGLTDKNNGIYFLQWDALIRKGRTMTEWGINQFIVQAEKAQAFRQGIQQRLEFSKRQLLQEESELTDLDDTLAKTKQDLREFQEKAKDTSGVLGRMDQLKTQIENKKDTIAKIKEDQRELENTVQTFKKEKMPPELVRFYLKDLILPVLNSLGSFKSIGSRVVFKESSVETYSIIEQQAVIEGK